MPAIDMALFQIFFSSTGLQNSLFIVIACEHCSVRPNSATSVFIAKWLLLMHILMLIIPTGSVLSNSVSGLNF
jgi:hypothetical protein